MRGLRAVVASLLLLAGAPAAAQPAERVVRLAVLAPTLFSLAAIRRGLASRGFVEGRNLVIDAREGAPEEFPAMARDLVAANPAAILAMSTALGAAKASTDRVPIVAFGPDPVEQGFAQTYARPGGNVTGVSIFAADLDGKRLEVLAEAIPGQKLGVLLHPSAQSYLQSRRAVGDAAGKLGIDPMIANAAGPLEYRAAFATMRAAGVRALVVTANSWFFRDRELLGTLAREAGMATICEWGDMARDVCTIGYGPQRAELMDRLSEQIARVLRGVPAGEIPVERPGRFDLVINARAATAIPVAIAPALLARADEVIE